MTAPAATTTQITHNDLDGYGCMVAAAAAVDVGRVEHVTRYSDVNPVMTAELDRLRGAARPELLLVSDIAVEPSLAAAAWLMAEAVRDGGRGHRLLVVDHHASSLEVLDRAGFRALDGSLPGAPHARAFVPRNLGWTGGATDAPVLMLVDTTRSATRIVHEERALLTARAAAAGPFQHPYDMPLVLDALVEAVDAIDLWDRDRPSFDAGEAVNELFWETVGTYLPAGHERHDAFMARILLDAALRIAGIPDCSAWRIEEAGNSIRGKAVDWLIRDGGLEEDPRQAMMTSRMRVSRLLARSQALFADPVPGRAIKLGYAMDPGIFQRTSDFMLDDGVAECVVNVMRGGNMSFRSRDGEAMAMAARFGGGGHPNAAGARLGSSAVFSLAEATRLFVDGLGNDPAEAPDGP